jgi:hypothetical protein
MICLHQCLDMLSESGGIKEVHFIEYRFRNACYSRWACVKINEYGSLGDFQFVVALEMLSSYRLTLCHLWAESNVLNPKVTV